ncbi:MAG: glycosyltransferase [Chloroflexota bacterium]|nr:glycosyltransferase [Dehalococcoidia bacterium]MDW8255120.1 glycosyltransferase [Chloroflexota bacterium]
MPLLHVGVDAAGWQDRQRPGRFARGIVAALAARDDLRLTLVADRAAAGQITLPPGARLLLLEALSGVRAPMPARGVRVLIEALRRGLVASRARFDLFFYPSVSTYAPVLLRTPHVVAVHNAVPERLLSPPAASRHAPLRWSLTVRWALWAARRILVPSAVALRRLGAQFRLPRRKVRVVGEAPDSCFAPLPAERIAAVLRDYHLPQPYLLVVGGFAPQADRLTLLRATFRLLHDVPALQLALVGAPAGDRFYAEPLKLRVLATALGLAERLRWLGHVSEPDMAALYGGAVAAVFSSLPDGEELSVVEAAACGVPIVASDQCHAADLIAGARVVPAGNDEALAAALRPLFDPERRRDLGDQLRRQAAAYRWEETAARAAAVFREAAQ